LHVQHEIAQCENAPIRHEPKQANDLVPHLPISVACWRLRQPLKCRTAKQGWRRVSARLRFSSSKSKVGSI
jgi:hypothetical protein